MQVPVVAEVGDGAAASQAMGAWMAAAEEEARAMARWMVAAAEETRRPRAERRDETPLESPGVRYIPFMM